MWNRHASPDPCSKKAWTIYQQFLLILAVLDLCFMALFSWVLYVTRKELLETDIDNTLRTVAAMAKELLPPDYHDRITGPESVPGAEYKKIVDRYNRLCVSLGLEYIWSVMLIDGQIVFTSSTSPDKVVSNGKQACFFERHSNPSVYLATFAAMRPTFTTTHDKWGDIRVALLPDVDSHGRKYLFASSVALSKVDRQLETIVFQSLGCGLLFFAGNLLLGAWLLLRVARPLRRLTSTIQSIAAGDTGRMAEVSGSCEVRTLACHFNRLTRVLQDKIVDLEAARVSLIGQHTKETKLAHDNLVNSEQRYHQLLNFAVDGILIGNHDGVIMDANECMCAFFGLGLKEIVGKHITEMPFVPEVLITNPFRFDLVHAGGILVRERTIRRADKTELVVEIHSKMMPDGTIQSIYRDITGRKRVERSLKEAYVLLENAQKIGRLGAWSYDIDSKKSVWSDEMYRILGMPGDTNIHNMESVIERVMPDQQPILRRAFLRAVNQCESYELELEFIRPDGEHIWICSRSQPLVEDERVVSLNGTVMDITDRKRSQMMLETMNVSLERRIEDRTAEVQRYADRLRALSGRLIRAEELERQRITHVLHEDVQQILVASRMTLEATCDLSQKSEVKDTLRRVDRMLSQAIYLTRSLVREISVPGAHEGELPLMVKWIAQEMKEKFGLTVDVHIDEGLMTVSENSYLCLYRAIQEILFNVVKHAKVSEAGICVERVGDCSVRVTIKDGGEGFSMEEVSGLGMVGRGMGLFGIRQMIEGLGGEVTLQSAKGQGVVVVLTLPVRDEV